MHAGEVAGAVRWAGADVRRRWMSLVLLGVLVGVTAGAATAAFIGSRRSDDALDRLRARTDAADVTVFASQAGYLEPDWEPLRAAPEVEQLAVWRLVFGSLPFEDFSVLFASDDGTWLGDLNAPLLVEGRMWDPGAAGEVLVAESAAEWLPLGSTFEFRTFSADQIDTEGPPGGPVVTLQVVGVVRTINEFVFTPGQMFLSPGFVATYGDEIVALPNADLRLRDPVRDLPTVRDLVQQVVGAGTPVFDLNAVSRRVDTTTSVESKALLLLAASIVIAGGLLVAQAAVRSAGVIDEDAPTLLAMGMTDTTIAVASVVSHGITFAVAGVTTAVTAILCSQFLPVGLSRQIDPDVGVRADWSVVLPAAVLAVAITLVIVVLVARRAAAPVRAARADRTARLVRLVRRKTPVPVALGTTMAFDVGTGARRLPIRPALLASIVGVIGVVATLTVDDGIDDALAHPERAGVVWDVTATPNEPLPADQALPADFVATATAAAGDGAATAELMRAVTEVAGVGQQVLTARPTGADQDPAVTLTITEGRAPRVRNEVAIGPRVARESGRDIGDEIAVEGLDGPARVVGIALFPPEVHVGFDEGVLVTVADFEDIVTTISGEARAQGQEIFIEHWLAIDLRQGADVDVALAAVTDALGERATTGAAETPAELANLRNIRTLPLVLAGFLALLAVASLAHVFAASVQRRRRDFAVLRTLGLGRGSTRLVLNAQGTSIALVGLLFGVPLGTVIGRQGWRSIAGQVPLTYSPPFALLAILVSVPLALLLANAIAIWPGRLVARMRIADQLRTE